MKKKCFPKSLGLPLYIFVPILKTLWNYNKLDGNLQRNLNNFGPQLGSKEYATTGIITKS